MADTDQNQQQQSKQPKTGKGVVAPRRSIDIPTQEKRVVGFAKDDNKPLRAAVVKNYGPGAEVELPMEEILALRKAGFLVDPDAAAIPVHADGAHIQEVHA